jgi:hypothetical protein
LTKRGQSAKTPPVGAVAQLGERVVRNDEVRGSIPLCSTKQSKNLAAEFRGLVLPALGVALPECAIL